MKREYFGVLMVLAGVVGVSPAAAAPNRPDQLPPSHVAFTPNPYETRVEFKSIRPATVGTVKGFFLPSQKGAVQLKVTLTFDNAKYTRSIVANVQKEAGGFSFTINFRGSDLGLPKDFNGTGIVHVTSNVKGTFQNMAKMRTN